MMLPVPQNSGSVLGLRPKPRQSDARYSQLGSPDAAILMCAMCWCFARITPWGIGAGFDCPTVGTGLPSTICVVIMENCWAGGKGRLRACFPRCFARPSNSGPITSTSVHQAPLRSARNSRSSFGVCLCLHICTSTDIGALQISVNLFFRDHLSSLLDAIRFRVKRLTLTFDPESRRSK